MPKEVFGRDFAVPAARRAADLRGDRPPRPPVRRPGRHEDPPHRRRAAAAPRPRAAGRRCSPASHGIADIALTTNGSLLAAKARALKAAGLTRVTVSLDALDDATFGAMNDVDFPVARVLAGIEAAADAGLAPVKINMVVKRGVNDHCLLPMARPLPRHAATSCASSSTWTSARPTAGAWTTSSRPREIVRTIDAEMPLEPLQPNLPRRGRRALALPRRRGEIGVIASVTQPFCGDCTRARLSADGKLYTCLFADRRPRPARAAARRRHRRRDRDSGSRRSGATRADRYSEIRTRQHRQARKVEMSYIGG